MNVTHNNIRLVFPCVVDDFCVHVFIMYIHICNGSTRNLQYEKTYGPRMRARIIFSHTNDTERRKRIQTRPRDYIHTHIKKRTNYENNYKSKYQDVWNSVSNNI